MQSMIGDIPLSPSIHPGNDTLNPSNSTEKKTEPPLNEYNPLPDDFDPDELRFQEAPRISNNYGWNIRHLRTSSKYAPHPK